MLLKQLWIWVFFIWGLSYFWFFSEYLHVEQHNSICEINAYEIKVFSVEYKHVISYNSVGGSLLLFLNNNQCLQRTRI